MNKYLLIFILLPSLSFSICLSPTEQAIVYKHLHGGGNGDGTSKSELKAEKNQAEINLKKADTAADELEEIVKDARADFSNTIAWKKIFPKPENKNKIITSEYVTKKITKYLESKHLENYHGKLNKKNNWDELDTEECSKNPVARTATTAAANTFPVVSTPAAGDDPAAGAAGGIPPIKVQGGPPGSDSNPGSQNGGDAEKRIWIPESSLDDKNIQYKKIKFYMSLGLGFLIPFAEATIVPSSAEECVDWKTNDTADNYFRANGKINVDGFCEKYELIDHDKPPCADALDKLDRKIKRWAKKKNKIREYKKDIIDIGEKINTLEDEEDEEGTEAGAACVDCLIDDLKKYRDLSKPTTGQIWGNIASIVAGVGLGYLGVKEARKARRETNELRAWQGFEAESNHGFNLAAIGLAYPFISRGMYGLTHGNRARGGYACAGGVNYHGRGGGWSGGWPGNFNGNGGFQGNFNGVGPFGLPGIGANAGLHFNAGGGWPGGFPGNFNGGGPFGLPGIGGNAGIYFNGGNGNWPGNFGGGGPFGLPGAGANAGLYFNAGGGWPGNFGGNGGWQGNFGGNGGWPGNFGGNGGWPGSFNGGINPQYQAHLARQQYQAQLAQQQYQARLEAQKVYYEKQQSIQAEWNRRRQVISGLTQEMYKIQQQINLISTTGVGSSSALGASSLSINAGINLGTSGNVSLGGSSAPQHNPAENLRTRSSSPDDLPVIQIR